MVAAYEVQAADIAASKGDGLRRHYGFDEEGTRFWDVHRTQEVDHAGWSIEALTALDANLDVVQAAATVRPTRGGSSSASVTSWRPSAHPAERCSAGSPWRLAASAKAAERSR